MHADLSRWTFRPERHYSRVVVQQGRVSLDADANAQASILLYYLRNLAADLIGEFGGPAANEGFQITLPAGGDGKTFNIGTGHYYVDGLLCVAETTTGDTTIDYFKQPDGYHQPDGYGALPALWPTGPGSSGGFLVWLKVWERFISAVEDPDLREIALGLNGPDTAGRAKLVWQVLVSPWPDVAGPPPQNNKGFYDPTGPWSTAKAQLFPEPTGTLMARAVTPQASTDVCTLSPSSGYRGPENQLYRVEIHQDGDTSQKTTQPTFTFSRDNGSVIAPITGIAGNVVSVTTLGRDPKLSIDVGNYVEIVDDAWVSEGTPGPMPRSGEPLHLVTAVDPVALTVTLDQAPATKVGTYPSLYPYLRRWDQEPGPCDQGRAEDRQRGPGHRHRARHVDRPRGRDPGPVQHGHLPGRRLLADPGPGHHRRRGMADRQQEKPAAPASRGSPVSHSPARRVLRHRRPAHRRPAAIPARHRRQPARVGRRAAADESRQDGRRGSDTGGGPGTGREAGRSLQSFPFTENQLIIVPAPHALCSAQQGGRLPCLPDCPFARRAPAASPGAERAPASVADAEVSPQRHAGRWTVGPGDQDDEWFHQHRRHRLTRTDMPTALNRPAIHAGPGATSAYPALHPGAATEYGCEREADRVADQALRARLRTGPGREHVRAPALGPGPAGPGSAPVPAAARDILRSPGAPLDQATRALMESSLGHDFSRVRVHTDEAAARSARALGARAYTVGRHVVLGSDRYRPDPAGQAASGPRTGACRPAGRRPSPRARP